MQIGKPRICFYTNTQTLADTKKRIGSEKKQKNVYLSVLIRVVR